MRHSEIFSIEIDAERIVSAEVFMPNDAIALLILAHGAGAGMNHSFMRKLSDGLYMHDVGTVRYNFLYMEQGRRRPDPPALAIMTVKKVISKIKTVYPNIPLFAGGKSFGGRMTSHFAAKENPDYLKGIVFMASRFMPPINLP